MRAHACVECTGQHCGDPDLGKRASEPTMSVAEVSKLVVGCLRTQTILHKHAELHKPKGKEATWTVLHAAAVFSNPTLIEAVRGVCAVHLCGIRHSHGFGAMRVPV
jgi:hypothetical protein